MANKLSLVEVEKELAIKNLTLVSDYNDYKNLSSSITVACVNGHRIETNINTIRADSFICNVCVGNASADGEINLGGKIPKKVGHRVVGFDNASHNMGVAIFDDNKLVYYDLVQFLVGNATQRLNKIRDFLETDVLVNWEADVIQIEDVQFQQNYNVFGVLMKLQGVFELACDRFKIPMVKTKSTEWRGHHGINHKNREKDKAAAIKKVGEMYGISVTDDVAEAILIAKYYSDKRSVKKLDSLF